jgi:transporter family protein
MLEMYQSWQFWAVISAAFAALTAILAKIGVENISSNFATLIRAIVILAVTSAIVTANKEWQSPASLARRTYAFLGLSGAATGASWLCYFRALKLGDAARVAPIDKLSVVLVAVFGVLFLGERLSAWNWLRIGLISAGAIMVAYRG